jgi:hypothetical protein
MTCRALNRHSWLFALPLSCFLILIVLIAFCGPASGADIPLIDAHSQVDNGVDMNQAVWLMNEAGIAHAILSSLRGGKKTSEIIAAAKRYPGRITPSIGLKGEAFRSGDAAALARIRQAGGLPAFAAMSEVMILHQQKGKVAPEIVVDFDAPQVREALSIALKRRWPLVMHIEFGFARARGDYEKYLKGLDAFLDVHPDHSMALTHMGQLAPAEVGRLIEVHRNVHFLTSHANTVWIRNKGHGMPWTDLFEGKRWRRSGRPSCCATLTASSWPLTTSWTKTGATTMLPKFGCGKPRSRTYRATWRTQSPTATQSGFGDCGRRSNK